MRRASIVVIVCALVLSWVSFSPAGQNRKAWEALRRSVSREHAAFPGSAGIVIIDLSTGWEIAINKSKAYPAASLVKIPIMAACFKAVEEGKLSLDTPIRLDEGDKAAGSGKLKAMPSGSVYTVEQLIELMIAESDNTATNILIERLTPEYLNAFFRSQGLTNTSLRRKMMDFSERRKGVENYTSAGDIALVLERMYKRRCVNPKVSERCMAVLLKQKMKDRIPKRLPRDTPVAHKTGLERNVCHDAGVVYTPAGDFLICVLTKSSSKQGFRVMKDFIAKTALTVYNTYQPARNLETGARKACNARKGG